MFNNFFKKAFDKKVDGTGLAVFRIAYSLVLLGEIYHLFYFRHLIYDKIPYILESEIHFVFPIAIWFIAVVFILFGLFTRFFTILNYILTLILVGSITTFEYHVFYAYLGLNFFMIFLPISQTLSLDRLLKKLKFSSTTFQYNPSTKIRQLYYFLPILVAIGLVYFDSVFHKLDSNSWLNGLGMWFPASLPMMAQNNISFLLNIKWLMVFIGFLTLIFEAVFIFLFFRKRFRVILLIIGVGLHIGIMIAFPIPFFGLTYCAVYLLLVPIGFWNKLLKRNSEKQTKLLVYYDVDCPLCVRTKLTVSHFNSQNKIVFRTVQYDAHDNEQLKDIDDDLLLDDIHSVDHKGKVYNGVDTYIKILSNIWYFKPLAWIISFPGINYIARSVYNYIAKNRNTERCTEENCGYTPPPIVHDHEFKILKNYTLEDLKFSFIKWLSCFFIIVQILIVFNSPLLEKLKSKIGFKNTRVEAIISNSIHQMNRGTRILFGLTGHGVFIDGHYDEYNHIIAVVYKKSSGEEIWLPLIDDHGQPGSYNQGFNWAKYSFRTNAPNIVNETLSSGIRDFTAFWAHKNGVNLKEARFYLKVKRMNTPVGWEYDFINKQIKKPWMNGGYVEWKDYKMSANFNDIEKL